MALTGVYNRNDKDGNFIAHFATYSQQVVDNFKAIPGNESLTDAEAFGQIMAKVLIGYEHTVIDDSEKHNYEYMMSGATYNFGTDVFDYDNALIGAYVNSSVVPSIASEIQAHMDIKANERGYDSIDTASSYAAQTAVTSFHDEGLAFLDWRSLVWAFCYTKLGAWNIGDEPITATSLMNDPGFPVLILP